MSVPPSLESTGDILRSFLIKWRRLFLQFCTFWVVVQGHDDIHDITSIQILWGFCLPFLTCYVPFGLPVGQLASLLHITRLQERLSKSWLAELYLCFVLWSHQAMRWASAWLVFLLRKNMYSGGENLQMNGDTPHDGGHGGGGHGDCEELQRTGRSVTLLSMMELVRSIHSGNVYLSEKFHRFIYAPQNTVWIYTGWAVTPPRIPRKCGFECPIWDWMVLKSSPDKLQSILNKALKNERRYLLAIESRCACEVRQSREGWKCGRYSSILHSDCWKCFSQKQWSRLFQTFLLQCNWIDEGFYRIEIHKVTEPEAFLSALLLCFYAT